MPILPDLPALAVNTTAGGGGSETSDPMRQRRRLAHLVLTYHASFDVAGTVTLSMISKEGTSADIITITGNTDGAFAPSAEQLDDAGAGTTSYRPWVIDGQLKVTVAGAGAALTPAVTAEFVFE